MVEKSPEITFKGFQIKTDDSLKDNEFYMINPKVLNKNHKLHRFLVALFEEFKND